MYQHLEKSKNILITGCGGGYDVFCGLDLFFNLKDMGKNVIFGNYSFTRDDLLKKFGEEITKCCFKIDKNCNFNNDQYIDEMLKDTDIPPIHILKNIGIDKDEYIRSIINPHSLEKKVYFPEYKLVKTLSDKYQINVPIYCFIGCGIKYLIESYEKIIELENIDTIILVDGGTDSLMTGSEGSTALGTPFEDISSIVAINNINIPYKFLYCLGFNIDRYHGVTDKNFLKNTSNIIKQGGFIGSYMLNKNNESTKKYMDTFMNCDPENSIVNSHIIASIQGDFGNYIQNHLKHRLGNSKQYIHPFMGLYWIYHLEYIYNNLKYDVNKLKDSVDEYEISSLLKI